MPPKSKAKRGRGGSASAGAGTKRSRAQKEAGDASSSAAADAEPQASVEASSSAVEGMQTDNGLGQSALEALQGAEAQTNDDDFEEEEGAGEGMVMMDATALIREQEAEEEEGEPREQEEEVETFDSGMVHVQPLYGDGTHGQTCVLLSLPGGLVLVDAGWDFETVFTEQMTKTLKRFARRVDAVLLTCSSLEHTGALPYLYSKLGCRAPILATQPVMDCTIRNLYDAVIARRLSSQFSAVSLSEIDDVRRVMEESGSLNWREKRTLPSSGITYMAVRNGRCFGGSAWRIWAGGADMCFLGRFARAEGVQLDGLDESSLGNPQLVVCDAGVPNESEAGLARFRPTKETRTRIFQKILGTLRAGNKVLVVTDASTRCTEVLSWLHNSEPEPGRAAKLSDLFTITFAGPLAYRVLVSSESYVEWAQKKMSDKFALSDDGSNPLRLSKVKTALQPDDLAMQAGPEIIVCPETTLQFGISAKLFPLIASEAGNLILMAGKPSEMSVGNGLWKAINSNNPSICRIPSKLQFTFRKRIPLEGQARKLWEERRKRRLDQQRRAENIATQENTERAMDAAAGAVDDRDGTVGRAMGRQAMVFPDVEPTKRKTPYGIDIDSSALPKMDDTSHGLAEQDDGPSDSERDGEDEAVEGIADTNSFEFLDEEDVPFNFTQNACDVPIRCNVELCDFAGRTDRRSVHTCVRKLLASHHIWLGDAEAVDEALEQSGMKDHRHATANQPAVIAVPAPPLSVAVSSTLGRAVNMLRTSKKQGQATWAAPVRAKIRISQEDQEQEARQLLPGDKGQSVGMAAGQVDLKALRVSLRNISLNAVFVNGELVVEDVVRVRAVDGKKRLVVSGPAGELLQQVRRAIMSGLVRV